MGTGFGLGSPTNYPVALTPWGVQPTPSGFSAFGGQGFGAHPLLQQYAQPVQHILQSLQVVPYQLQQLQQLQYIEQQQLQQLLQVIPAQLQQLQQVIQIITLQIQQLPQQLQAQQLFGQVTPGVTGLPISQPFGGVFGPPFQPASTISTPFTGLQGPVM
jgi:hypothetical protein